MAWFRNPFDVAPLPPAAAPGLVDPTGELGAEPDALLDSEHAPPAPPGERLPVEFRGECVEYARLWYVTLFLTLVTLGIYSAWAKVRLRRYIASRTFVGGVPLVYRGDPLPILKGRLLAALLLALAWAGGSALPLANPLLITAAIALAPWFLLRSFEFNARNYSWRGLCFSFHAPYLAAAAGIAPLLIWPLSELALLLLDRLWLAPASWLMASGIPLLIYALLWPYSVATVTRLRFSGMRYGSMAFTLDATNRDFYRLYYRGLGWPFAVLTVVAGVLASIALIGNSDWIALVRTTCVLAASALAIGFTRGRRFNLALHRLVGDCRVRFRSTLEPKHLASLYLRNACWLMATAGFSAPWRLVLTLRERARCVSVFVDSGLHGVQRDPSGGAAAFGDALAEGLHLDLSL